MFMKKSIRFSAFLLTLLFTMSMFFTMSYAAEIIDNSDSSTEITATITGTDNTLARANAYAVVTGKVKIHDDNHMFNKAVEVWAVADTYYLSYSSGTADGIPDWYLTAKALISVSNGDVRGWVSSPSKEVFNKTSVTEQTKVIHAKDGGSAAAMGFHAAMDYYREPQWNYTSEDSERF